MMSLSLLAGSTVVGLSIEQWKSISFLRSSRLETRICVCYLFLFVFSNISLTIKWRENRPRVMYQWTTKIDPLFVFKLHLFHLKKKQVRACVRACVCVC